MTVATRFQPRRSGKILRNIGFVALPLLALVWSLADLTLGRELLEWVPYLASGFGMNILIALCAMALGTLVGVLFGILELVPYRLLRYPVVAYVQIFRNAPHLVLIFATTYIFPFEIVVFGNYLPFPDWVKAVIGLAIPASAYVAEITRGAILSIPTTQWEAAKGLGLSRNQALRWIILPQCLRRSLPPWMNVAASITMGTALASLVGVHELLHAATDASTAVRRLDFTVIAYIVVMAAFFTLCYPIARLTRRLERRFNAA
ncbi:amino acid ABC transporter permease [Rhizobium leguminosarum]|uniref:Amino acid ABC transporter permease n=2 Tax=Rhizobium TaxID=379 RepID=A0A444I6I0_RHILE|nr:amino acid ABC transporter permease [Rhizobium leguminosarum]NKL66791.1 ABC transporter permease subunit [Rhizobium leguminosarum bv. viciae]TBE58313.1 amino acid ABC transporter permease [Rhizobium beringeri]RWX13812.1 amino acid ABC transporter permease [Rhizobium leguminosarum]RWX33991.1 amino acid ABC transporter permease [Rhizobium leguminosarum]